MKISLCFLFLFGAMNCFAQPFTLDEKIKPTELRLTEFAGNSPKEKGKISVVEVTQRNETLYFFVKGASILSTTVVYIDLVDRQNKLAISLHKDLWTEMEQSGNTDSEGIWKTAFKTGGDFGIKITSKRLPVKYQLLVWVGDEVNIDMPSPFKKPKSSR